MQVRFVALVELLSYLLYVELLSGENSKLIGLLTLTATPADLTEGMIIGYLTRESLVYCLSVLV